MARVLKKWWLAGLALSGGCATEPVMPEQPPYGSQLRPSTVAALPKASQTPVIQPGNIQATKANPQPVIQPASVQAAKAAEAPAVQTASFQVPKPPDAPEKAPPPKPEASTELPASNAQGLQVPDLKPLPINLPTALKLMNARAWDISIAVEGVRSASAQLQAANVLWVPSLVSGIDYQHHDGAQQAADGTVSNASHGSFAVGLAPTIVFSTADAVFEPLAARQIESARRQQLQATTNDTTLSVAQAYFGVQEARGDLAGVRDTIRRTNLMLARIESLAPDLVPRVEVSRARAQLAHFEQAEESASERWNFASASLVRILRMNPATVVEPAEPPTMKITLINPDEPIENLLSLALASRPELAATRNLTAAAEARWREERYRPLLPNIYMRGNSGQLPDSLAFSGYGGGSGSNISGLGVRDDFELQVMWELKNFGFGNAALIKGRRAEMESARQQAYRAQDIVAQEVVQAAAQMRSAAARAKQAERGLREAVQSAEDNYSGLGETKRVGGNIVVLVIRPQEAIASVQALQQAYYDYFGAIADYNRAEFGLYRALGNPSQALADATANGNCAPAVPPVAPPPAQPLIPVIPVAPLGPDALKN